MDITCYYVKKETTDKVNLQIILGRTTWTNSSKGKPDLVVDQDQWYKITLKI